MKLWRRRPVLTGGVCHSLEAGASVFIGEGRETKPGAQAAWKVGFKAMSSPHLPHKPVLRDGEICVNELEKFPHTETWWSCQLVPALAPAGWSRGQRETLSLRVPKHSLHSHVNGLEFTLPPDLWNPVPNIYYREILGVIVFNDLQVSGLQREVRIVWKH